MQGVSQDQENSSNIRKPGLIRFGLFATIVGLLIGVPASGWADNITFNLESIATGTYTIVSETENGLTLTAHRADNDNFTIDNLSLVGGPPAFGNRSLGNFSGAFGPGATLIFNFSAPIVSGSVSFGDFDVDDDSPVVLTGFSGLNGTGSNLGSSSVSYPSSLDFGVQGDAAIRTLTVSVAGIQSLTISSGGPFPGSLNFDNIVGVTPVAPVPEPASILLVGCGLLVMAASRRFR
jgi:hypothetical protein